MAEKKRKSPIVNIIDGSILLKKKVSQQLPFVIFLIILAFTYIANRLKAEKTVWEIAKTEKELKILKAESASLASELIFLSNKKAINEMVKTHKLEINFSKEPPKKIILNKE